MMIRSLIFLLALASLSFGDEKKSFDKVFGEIRISGADSSLMDERAKTITFQGEKVEVQIGKTLLTCEKIVIQRDEEGEPGAFVATSKMVVIERENSKGETEVGKCRTAKWDVESGRIELSGGPPTYQSGSNMVNPSSPQAMIVLFSDGRFEVSGNTSKGCGIPIGHGKKQQPLPSVTKAVEGNRIYAKTEQQK